MLPTPMIVNFSAYNSPTGLVRRQRYDRVRDFKTRTVLLAWLPSATIGFRHFVIPVDCTMIAW